MTPYAIALACIWSALLGVGVGLVVAVALMELRFRADRRPGYVSRGPR